MKFSQFKFLSFIVFLVICLLSIRDITIMNVRILEIFIIPLGFVLVVFLMVSRPNYPVFRFLVVIVLPVLSWIFLSGLFAQLNDTLYSISLFVLNTMRLLICFFVAYIFYIYIVIYGLRGLKTLMTFFFFVGLYETILFSSAVIKNGFRINLTGFLNSNYYASFFLIPVMLILVATLTRKLGRTAWLASLLFSLFLILQLIMTTSRAAILSLILSAAFMLWKAWGSRINMKTVLALTLVVVCSLCTFYFTFSYVIVHEGNLPLISTLERKSTFYTSRYDLWESYITVFTEHPILGVGFGQGPFEISEEPPMSSRMDSGSNHVGSVRNVEHNLMLELLMIGGIPLTLFMVYVLVQVYGGFNYAAKSISPYYYEAVAWEAAFIAQIVMALSINSFTIRHLWMFIGIGLGLREYFKKILFSKLEEGPGGDI